MKGDLHVFKIKTKGGAYDVKTVVPDLVPSRLLRTKVTAVSVPRPPFVCCCLEKSCNAICSLSSFGLRRHRLAAGGGVSSESGSRPR